MKIDKAFAELAKDSFGECNEDLENLWVILIDGQRISTRSHKRLWERKSSAINALHNHLSATVVQRMHTLKIAKQTGWSFSGSEIQEEKKRWMKEHSEIITLKEWSERKGR